MVLQYSEGKGCLIYVSFSNLVNRLKREGEEYILQAKGQTETRDEIGNFIQEWQDIHKLDGIIQHSSEFQEVDRGQEEIVSHKGFFVFDFDFPIEKIQNYRIKHVIPTIEPQERLYRIASINRDLRLNKKQHHYEMDLTLDKRW